MDVVSKPFAKSDKIWLRWLRFFSSLFKILSQIVLENRFLLAMRLMPVE